MKNTFYVFVDHTDGTGIVIPEGDGTAATVLWEDGLELVWDSAPNVASGLAKILDLDCTFKLKSGRVVDPRKGDGIAQFNPCLDQEDYPDVAVKFSIVAVN